MNVDRIRERPYDAATVVVLATAGCYVLAVAASVSGVGRSDPVNFVEGGLKLADATAAGDPLGYLRGSIDPPLRYVPFALAYLVVGASGSGPLAARVGVAIVGLSVFVAAPAVWTLVARARTDDLAGPAGLATLLGYQGVYLLSGWPLTNFPEGSWQYSVAMPWAALAVYLAVREDPTPRTGGAVGAACGVTVMVQSGVALFATLAVAAAWAYERRWRPLGAAAAVGTVSISPIFLASNYAWRMWKGLLNAVGDGSDGGASLYPAGVGDLLWRLSLSRWIALVLLLCLAVGCLYALGYRRPGPVLAAAVAATAAMGVAFLVGPLRLQFYYRTATYVGLPAAVVALVRQGRPALQDVRSDRADSAPANPGDSAPADPDDSAPANPGDSTPADPGGGT